MRAVLELLKSLLTGGFLFLLPLGIIIVIFGKLLSIAQGFGHILEKSLFPDTHSASRVLLIAVLILVILALLAGLFARTGVGKRIYRWFEKILLSRLPLYTYVRQMLPDSGTHPLGEARKTPVVTARLDDQTVVGLLIDTMPDGRKVIYLPNAPNALSGMVTIFDADRVEETGLKPGQLLSGLRRLGAGMVTLARRHE